MQTILFVTLLLVNLWYIHCSTTSTCGTKITCDSCFGVPGCAWCKKLSHKNQRCNIVSQHAHDKCSGADILEAKSSLPNIITAYPITKTMRITPQKYNATLAVEKEVKFSLTYKDTTDKPLDLYYVMDLSYTMKDDKDTVSSQAQHLVNELKRITSDVQLGFGAFIDKPVLPFVASSQLRENPEYDIPYGFKNWLSLTNDTAKFSRVVNSAKISRNLDEPEGTLDALMQAIVCKEIGWRSAARKLIVVATDGPFHIAGDGKLGGIVRPNDMKCHLDKDGMYTHSKLLDYPSIGEINAVILQQKVYVIFAVSNEQSVYNLYKELQNHISQSTAEKLSRDSSNVVQKIKTKYEEISKRVDLSVAKKPDFVDVEVYAKCSTSTTPSKQMHCTNVNVGSQIEFEIRVKLKRCPDVHVKNDNEILISFFELSDKETLKIELEYDCTCKTCEKEQIINYSDLNKYCSGMNATKYISCGTCICQDDRYGPACQCSKDGENEQDTIRTCENPKTHSVCTDRGECKCGSCQCQTGFNGKYCEYSTDGCQRSRNDQTGSLCSDRGECDKGQCVCNKGFQGKLCECEKSKEVGCIEPGKPLNSPVCNGHGTCDCQQYQCKCDTGYGGLYCGVCKVNCPPGSEKSGSRCQDEFIQKCVRCKVQSRQNPAKRLDEKCNELCDPKNFKQRSISSSSRADVSTVEFNERNSVASLSDVDGTECRIKINDEPCYSIFKYSYQRVSQGTPDVLQVYFTHDGVTCAKEPPFVWYILGVIASILLLGIFSLLIWKLATHIHDTREFQRFEKETKHARWGTGDNPLYETPRSEFQNPAYRE